MQGEAVQVAAVVVVAAVWFVADAHSQRVRRQARRHRRRAAAPRVDERREQLDEYALSASDD